MKVRFFGSSDCRDCLSSLVEISKAHLDCTYIDALNEDKEIQFLCDQQDVNRIPHVQFLNDDGDVVVNHIGILSKDDLNSYLSNCFPNY